MVKQPPQGLHLETCNQPRRQRSRRWSGSLQRELRYHRTREPRGASGSGKGCSLSSLLLGEVVASGIRREQGGSSLRQGPREQGRRQPWTCVLASFSPQMGKATLRGFSLGSVSYYNTLLQTSWLNAIHIYALTILESEVLMCLPSVGSRQESVPLTCPVSRGCPLSLALSHSTVISRLWGQIHKFVSLPLAVPKGHPHSLACGFFLHLQSRQHSQRLLWQRTPRWVIGTSRTVVLKLQCASESSRGRVDRLSK